MNFKPFPGLTDILLSEQRETSGGYWHKHKFEGVVYSPNLGFRKSIPQAINSPPYHQETKSSNSSNVIMITAWQRDN